MCVEIEKIYDGAICGETEVTIDLIGDEANKLKEALAVVRLYEKKALRAAKINKKEYTGLEGLISFNYNVKKDKVIVNIKEGAIG